jgi:hypothetical protein
MPTSKISHDIKHREKPNDVFMTPLHLVTSHIDYVKHLIRNDDKILEPFCGSGNYLNQIKEKYPSNNVDYCEITLGRDFFDYVEPTDIIISNPPYSIIDNILKKSIELKPRVISYLIAMHNLTPRRIEILNDAGYYLESMKMIKVFKWYGISVIVTFVKDSNGKNVVDFDRVVYK